jgi:hypothetical protein
MGLSNGPAVQPVYVILQGPWAFAQDPDNPGQLVAIAPFSQHHTPLYIGDGSEGVTLTQATYKLNVPVANRSGARKAHPYAGSGSEMKKDDFRRLRDTRGEWYVFLFPQPDEINSAKIANSSVRTTWDGTGTTATYTSEMSLLYMVSSLDGFSAECVPNATFDCSNSMGDHPQPYQVIFGIPANINIGMLPVDEDDVQCHNHSRMAFRELVEALGLTLYVDFPSSTGVYDSACRDCDPQSPNYNSVECDRSSLLKPLRDAARIVAGAPPSIRRRIVLGEITEVLEARPQACHGQCPRTKNAALVEKIADIRSFLRELTKSDKGKELQMVLQQIDQTNWPFFVPPRDCKNPTIQLTLKN